MPDKEATFSQIITQRIVINAATSKIWEALTNPRVMNKWMYDSEIDIITDWKVGHAISISGDSYESRFENKGIVLQFEPERFLQYNHLSSLSNLPDKVENYTVIGFTLTPAQNQTALVLTLSNFPTEIIYKHFAFYWAGTLGLLKTLLEQ
ncbi:MAG: SRPBCC domain-containing protein [Mucilaginibacter sp.]|uniref:SRPBCC family protein n=1 Tax=Mucilaginibacter sp. TaxID=1882438 RepID=UPI0032666F39